MLQSCSSNGRSFGIAMSFPCPSDVASVHFPRLTVEFSSLGTPRPIFETEISKIWHGLSEKRYVWNTTRQLDWRTLLFPWPMDLYRILATVPIWGLTERWIPAAQTTLSLSLSTVTLFLPPTHTYIHAGSVCDKHIFLQIVIYDISHVNMY